MSLEKIGVIIEALRGERYRWSPVRRVYILKKNGKKRPLGLPTWSDKLVAEVVRLLLEAYYDIQFSDHSHGFRPGRGCHTALNEVESMLCEFVEHGQEVRPHDGLGQRTPSGEPMVVRVTATGRIVRRDRLSGLIREYERAAA